MDTTTQLLGGALIARDTSSSLDEFKLYHYDPSIGGAVAFVLLFLGTTSFHTYQSFRTRCWFVIPFIIGGICKLRSSVISSRKKKEQQRLLLTLILRQSSLLAMLPVVHPQKNRQTGL